MLKSVKRCQERMWGGALYSQRTIKYFILLSRTKGHEISFWYEIKVWSPSRLQLQIKYELRHCTCNLNDAERSYAWNYMTSPNKHYTLNKIITCEFTPSQEQQNQAQFHFFTSDIFHVKAGESTTAAKQVSRHARYHTWTFELTHLKRKAWFLLLWSATIAVKMSPVKAMKVKTQMGVLVNIWLSHTVDTKSNMTPLQRDQLTHTHCLKSRDIWQLTRSATMSQQVRTESKEQSRTS